MSAIDPIAAGMLEVLDDLPEHGRRRYVRHRTREELEGIIVATWRERDDAMCLMEEHEHNRFQRSPSPGPDSDLVHQPDQSPGSAVVERPAAGTGRSQGLKREPASSPARSRKRARKENTPTSYAVQVLAAPIPPTSHEDHAHTDIKNVASMDEPEASSNSSTAGGTSGDNNSSEDGASTSEDDSSDDSLTRGISSNSAPTRAPTKVVPKRPITTRHDISSLPKIALIKQNGDLNLTKLTTLPAKVRKQLVHRLTTFLSRKRIGAESPPLTIETAAIYSKNSCCIYGALRKDVTKYTRGGQQRQSADDACIADRLPCAHIVRHNKGFAIGFVPLPEKVRRTEKRGRLTYWVRK